MKILIVTLEYPPVVGGIATYTLNVASQLKADEVVVCAPKDAGAEEFDKQHAWKTYRCRPFWLWWPRWIPLFFQIRKIVKQEKITALHIHHALPGGYAARYIKKFFKISYTIFLHGSDWQISAQHTFKLKKLGWVCRGAERVVVNSQFAKQSLATLIPYLPEMKVVYPCPHDSFYNPNYAPGDVESLRHQLALGGKKVILTVSRMVDRKGHARLAKCLPAIVKQDPNVVWLVVGDGPEMTEVMRIIQENNLQGMVRFVSSQPPEKVAIYYQLADIFVLLTHKDRAGVEEAWGTIFIEAASAGLPVVAGRSGGVAEAVQHMQTGLVVDSTNEAEVVNSIISLLHNPGYAKEMGNKGKSRAEQEFRWDVQLTKLR